MLLDQYRPAMLAVALGVLGRPSDAEDAVQDAMLAALGRIQDLRDPVPGGHVSMPTRPDEVARALLKI